MLYHWRWKRARIESQNLMEIGMNITDTAVKVEMRQIKPNV